MNDSEKAPWFFTLEGERIGPVSFADLRVKAANGELNPRLGMVWTQGMEDWKPSGEIVGLFEKRTETDTSKESAPPSDPYKAPKQESVAESMSREGGWPGARRRLFLIMTFVFPIVWNIGFAFGSPFLAQQLGPEIMMVLSIVLVIFPIVIGIYFGLQRLANLGMSRWWYLGHLVPFLNLWVGYRSFACPAGYAYHKKLDGIGWVLAILYWLSVLMALLIFATIIAVFAGLLDQPELRQHIDELIRQVTAQRPKS